jgi:hypothetical protein
MILEVKDPAKYVYEVSNGYKDIWNRDNSICFEMLNGMYQSKKDRCYQAITELNQRLRLNCRFEKRMTKCLVITKNKNASINSDTTGLMNGNRMEPSGIALFMDMTNKFPPVLDESKSNEVLVISNVTDLIEVRKQLAKYGYSIEEAIREIEMLVVTEI